MNSRAKGKRGELEFAEFLREHGVQARRGVQYNGLGGEDVLADLPGVHLEIKRVEKLNIHEAYSQAYRDAGLRVPVVVFRRSRGPWLVALSAEAWLDLMKRDTPPEMPRPLEG